MGNDMRYSTDGGQTWQKASELRVSVDEAATDEDCAPLDLAVNFTHEGIVTDLMRDGEVVGTDGRTYEEIVDRLDQSSR